jgi:Rps23 Pro-64 3,4-dihydroxylase Tpa1-like proline 4-hydroxylase
MSINITKNVFSNGLLEKLYAHTRTEDRQPTRTNFFGWDGGVTGTSNAIFLFRLEQELKKAIAEELIAKNIFKQVPKIWGANIYLMSRNSFIPWHDDAKHKFTCTVYLNKEWHSDLGGYFIYQDGEDKKALVPEYNMAVSFAPPVGHTCTITALNASFRESLQIFVQEF